MSFPVIKAPMKIFFRYGIKLCLHVSFNVPYIFKSYTWDELSTQETRNSCIELEAQVNIGVGATLVYSSVLLQNYWLIYTLSLYKMFSGAHTFINVFTQPLRSGRVRHKVNLLGEFNRFEVRVFLLLD